MGDFTDIYDRYSSCGPCFEYSYSDCSPNSYGTPKPKESTQNGFQTLLLIWVVISTGFTKYEYCPKQRPAFPSPECQYVFWPDSPSQALGVFLCSSLLLAGFLPPSQAAHEQRDRCVQGPAQGAGRAHLGLCWKVKVRGKSKSNCRARRG